MQQLKDKLRGAILLAVALLVGMTAWAQGSSINAFSPYTMYGIGELNTPGTMASRSMGGVGVAARVNGTINLLNPAGLSMVARKSFLLNFGGEGQNYYNYQTQQGVEKSSAHNSFNLRDIAVLFPLYKNLGMSVAVTPYSSVGYQLMYDHHYDASDPVWGNVGRVNYAYKGEGDLTEVKIGVGYQLFKNFSVGVSAQYYWGDIDREFVMTPVSMTGDGVFGAITGHSEYAISRFKGQVGVQYSPILNQKRILTFGAAYDFGGDLAPKVTESIYGDDLYQTTVKGDTTQMELVLPRKVVAGVYYQTARWSVGLDYEYQGWGDTNSKRVMTGVEAATGRQFEVSYTDTHTIKAGVEFVPARYDVRRFFNRLSYRAGVRYGNYHQSYSGQKLDEMAVTIGIGIPIKFLGISAIDIGAEYGRRGYNVNENVGLVRQQYFKFGIGFKLFAAGSENNEYWFMRPKYD